MAWFIKHFFLKVILAAFALIFGLSFVRFLAWIVILMSIFIMGMIGVGIYKVYAFVKGAFS